MPEYTFRGTILLIESIVKTFDFDTVYTDALEEDEPPKPNCD
jgi:hypothetical protein